ncbi:MAG: malectin domain-containing carbohydrate-binding protein, partial [Actinomycetota bacterium]
MSNRPVLHRRGRIHRIGISVMLVLGILSLPSSASAAEQPAVFRVNAGGAELPGTPAWTADTGSNPSSFVNAAATGNKTSAPNANVNMTHPSLPAGTPVDLFKTERWDPAGDPEMKWSFPVTEGAYEARLYFAETYSGTQSVGARVFDVSIEGGVVLNDYDIFADVGGHTAVMKSFIVSSDSSLDIELGHVTENPAIKGIEILPAAGAAGELAASPTSLSFGSVNLGATKEMSVNLTNLGATGDPDIVVEGTDIGGSDPGQFSDDFNDAADVTLSPGESTPIAVDFAPTTKGAKSASLDVAHNGSNIVSVSLAGSGNEVLPGAWQTLPSSSIDRQEVAHVQVDGRFYLAGGLATGATAVEMYDPIAETWTTVGQMPEALDHIQAVAIGTKIYLIGGLNNWPADDSANVYIYDTETDDFTEGAPMPNARERGAGGVAVHNGKIYYAGGLHDGAAVNWFDVYDPVTDDWSALSDMPNGRDHFQAAVLNGKFYAIGGRNQAINAFVNVNQAYDFSTGQWAAGLAPLPTARGGFATAVLGDEIIVMGGEGGGKVFSEVEAYKPSTNTWRSLAPMTTARHGIQAAVCNDGIYLAAGGETQGGGTPGNVHDVFFLNGATTCSPPEQTGALGASPTNFGFGHVPVGSTKDQTIQLTNLGSTGDADIVVDSTTMEGIGADQFQDSFNDAGDVTLSPGESTTFQATFAPTNTGSKAATLKVNHDGSNSPVDIDLTGTSTAGGSVVYRINAGGPPVDDLPSGWAADTTAAPAAQVNTGSNTFSTGQNINMTHASIPAGTPQAVFKDERYDPVGDPSMQWDFPVAPGDYEVRLYFAELFLTGAGQRLFDVNIEGITALKNYDIVAAAGAPKKGIVETFMVSSDGNLDIDFLRAVENPTVTAIEIREISADAPGDPGVLGALPTSVGFGDTAVDSTKDQTIQVTNLGGLGDPAIVVDNTTIEGANAGQFQDSFNDAGDVTLAPGESTTFQATFAPTAAGNKTATLKVHHDGSNNPISIDLSAIATDNSGGTVLYRINSGGPAVGDLPVGWAADTAAAPAPQVNSGNTASGTGQAIDVTHGSIPAGTPPTLFKDERYDQAGDPDMQWDFPVTAGDYEVRLYFAELFVTGPTQRMFDVNIEGVTALKNYDIFAAAGGAKKGIVETFMVSSDANLDIDFLRGVENPTVTAIEIREMSADAPGDPGALGALPTNVGFANTAVGATKDQSIQLTNLGSAGDPDIVVGSTTIEGADADQFEDSFNDAGDVTLSPGESTTFQATFAPTTAGSKAATLKVHHDGSNSPVDIDLTGTSTVGGAIVYRINAGGPLISDVPLGWAADTAAAPAPQVNTGNSASATGQAIDMSHSSIPPGTPAAVFKDERFDQPSDPNMQWDFPVSPGDYEVRLFFAELFVNAPSQRSFDVKIEGATALKNYDIFAAAGGGEKGIVETFKVSSDDNLDIDFQRGLENPTITGIEIRETHTPIVAEDAFGRTLIDSWGSADTGGAWNVLAGSAGNFDVDGAAGKIITPSGGGQQLIDLPGTSVRDVDYRANIKFAAKPNTNEHFAYLTLRRQSGGAYYRIGLVLDPTGNVAIRGQTGAGADLFDDVVAPVTYNQGDELTLRVTAHGANPTTLRAKVWKVGTEEPETWDVTDSDSTAGLQAPGSLGLRTITLSNTATTVGIDQLKAISRDGFIDTVPGATPGPTAVGFGKSTLAGHSTVMPTSLQFGPDGRLYVAQFDGTIKIYTITRNDLNSYSVTGTQTITSIQSIPNHDDNGALNAAQNTRIVTGLLVTGTAANPVIYVTSSDPRIGGHTMGGDLNLDTNSSMLSRLTWNGSQWVKLDLVRGLPRSEENHASNGLALDQSTNTLFIAQGGHTNQGATSNNFALLPEFALSAAILSVDLDQIGDTTYDIPTLDDETQAGTNDATDPFGGNDGKNQAKIVPGGPVQVYSPGFRNPYDIEITKSGKMYTIDNGGNAGWGAPPVNEGPGGTCTNGLSEPGVSDPDALHLVTPGYYGGHPNPTRANKSNTFNSNAQSPVPTANPIECDYRKPGTAAATDLTTFPSSTNGIDEYTASNFGEAMKGNLLSSGYVHNTIYRVQLDPTGTEVTQNGPLFSSVGKNPLDLTAQSDSGPFPGTIWVADLLGTTFTGQIYVYEPNDYGQTGPVVICTGEDDTTLDEDADGFKNADEIANGTDPCSAGDFPPDADGDKISDLTDPDDDNDGQLDTADPFAIDETNGMGTDLPLTYTWENDEPDPGGLLKLGFTGAMTNGTSNYADLFDPEKMTASGAAGVLTVDEAGPGDALMQLNDQEYGLQFGIDANPSTTNTFTVHSRVLAPFAGVSPEDDQSMGIFIGNGDQDNYAKLVVSANGGSGGIHYVKEAGGVAVERPQAPVSVPGPSYIDLYLKVDPDAGTLQPSYSVTNGSTTGPITKLGNLGQLPTNWFSPTKGLAVGI